MLCYDSMTGKSWWSGLRQSARCHKSDAEQKTQQAQQEALKNANDEIMDLRGRADDLRAAGKRLQHELGRAYTALTANGINPIAASNGNAAGAPAALLAELHTAAIDHAGRLAETADDCYHRARACEASYAALSCR